MICWKIIPPTRLTICAIFLIVYTSERMSLYRPALHSSGSDGFDLGVLEKGRVDSIVSINWNPVHISPRYTSTQKILAIWSWLLSERYPDNICWNSLPISPHSDTIPRAIPYYRPIWHSWAQILGQRPRLFIEQATEERLTPWPASSLSCACSCQSVFRAHVQRAIDHPWDSVTMMYNYKKIKMYQDNI